VPACRAPAANANASSAGAGAGAGASLLSGTDLAGLLVHSFAVAEVGEALITRFLDLLP
jgi:hypothetical protein